MNIFIHRRDLRYDDNTTLIKMNKKFKDNIYPIFIFNPKQIYEKKNKYFSNNLVQFLCESITDLFRKYEKKNNRLTLFEGNILDILKDLHKKNKINSVGFNMDYSPFSKKRDEEIKKWCLKNKIEFICEEDMLLSPILSGNSLNPNSDKPYNVFTPFMKNLKLHNKEISTPNNIKININTNIIDSQYKISLEDIQKYYIVNNNIHVNGKREYGINILKNIKDQKLYNEKRNFLSYSTTNLSAYINLGLVSIREVYHTFKNKLGPDNSLITELYWRDFYYNILYYYPHIVGNSFNKSYSNIKWNNNKKFFDAWKNGKTGFPVVDACMNQLNTTGYMHNRGRMIVASFLTKDLLIDWKLGEKYFANNLVDYNISANNGGWQWAAGTGTDAQPYFRIFNPWTQSKKFDPNCEYIKKWLPELGEVKNEDIHKWNEKYTEYKEINYPKPIVDHSIQRKKALDMYKNL